MKFFSFFVFIYEDMSIVVAALVHEVSSYKNMYETMADEVPEVAELVQEGECCLLPWDDNEYRPKSYK